MTRLPPAAPRRPSPAEIALDVLAASCCQHGAESPRRQRQRLCDLLQAAMATRHYGHSAAKAKTCNSCRSAALPVTGKPELMQQFAQRVTDPALTLPALRALCADPHRIAEHHLGRYHVWESSGSTGQAGPVLCRTTPRWRSTTRWRPAGATRPGPGCAGSTRCFSPSALRWWARSAATSPAWCRRSGCGRPTPGWQRPRGLFRAAKRPLAIRSR